MTESVRACEDFLRMERTHTNSCMRKPRRTYAYRERSIDDGSRYDPRLDEISASRSYTRGDPASLKSSLKAEKKTGSLAKVSTVGGGVCRSVPRGLTPLIFPRSR